MRGATLRWAAAAAAALVASAGFGQVKGDISEVRVYRGQALVTRTVPLAAKEGAQELTVTGLPEQLAPDSLYATGDDNLTIRAVRYRTDAVKEAARPEVAALDKQIAGVQATLAKIASDLGVITGGEEYLAKLEGFVVPTAHGDLNKGVLDAKQLMDVTDFLFKQRRELATGRLELEAQQKEANDQLALLQRQRGELAGGGEQTLREAVLFVEAAKAQPSTIFLNYVVGGVNWTPAYVARLNGARDKLVLEYHGVVTQTSGEDWPNVSLTLSTSQPNMVASAPLLSPLWLSLARNEAEQRAAAGDAAAYNGARRELEGQLRAPQAVFGQPGGFGGGGLGGNGPASAPAPVAAMPQAAMPQGQGDADATLGANVLAARLQNLELAAPDEVVKAARKMKTGIAEGLAVDYALPGKVSLASRADQQMFRIALLNLPADFYYTSVPLLSNYIYQAAAAVNNTDTTLLPGPYNAYLDGAFAGRGELPVVAKGESMTLGFGTESQLRISRELSDKKTEIKGGNKVLTLNYLVRLQNFMGKAVKVRVWDRLPQAPNDQVQISLVAGEQGLSTDALYVEQEKPRGLLRWDVDLAAGATGAKAQTLAFGYRLEFDKQLAIGELPQTMVDRMRKDLDAIRDLKR
jgi:hypothetical protein